MTVEELTKFFNDTWGLTRWPPNWEVDAETYANVCQEVFNRASKYLQVLDDNYIINVVVGPNHGIMFKNVELILKHDK